MDEFPEEPTRPDVDLPGPQLLASRMRFEDPEKFLQFYEKQLSKNLVGLRHPEAIASGTSMLVIVSPPGAPDQLRLHGTATRVTPRPDGTARLRVEVTLQPRDVDWLDAYLGGLRAALAFRDREPAAPRPAPPPTATRDEILDRANRIDTLTYYQLLGVDNDIALDVLQTHFHGLTRRFHPDLFHAHEDAQVAGAVNAVYRRMNEAYAVLKSSHRRKAYDEGLAGPPHTWVLRLSEDDHEQARRRERVRRGSTRVGDFYWTTAREVLKEVRGDDRNIRPALRESARLLRVAIAFEPDNEHFRHALEHVTDRLAQPLD